MSSSAGMGDHDLGTGPIEMPAARIHPTARRRHRPITGTSGILLFACLFLPAIDGCNRPITPLLLPPLWPPYLYGLVFAAIALIRTQRGLDGGLFALRVLSWLVVATGIAMTAIAPPIGAIELASGIALVATLGWSSNSERRAATTGVVVGAISTACFGLWCTSSDALHGVYLAFASSVALVIGALIWLADLAAQPRQVLPDAVARRAR